MPSTRAVSRSIVRYPEVRSAQDFVTVEEPLEIRIDGEPLAVTMRTPGHDEELAAGFCFTEAIIASPDDLERVELCALADYGNVVLVTLSEDARRERSAQVRSGRRELYLSSSCGLCGTQTIDRLQRTIKPVQSTMAIDRAVLSALPQKMSDAQETFARTGGLHAAALFHANGEMRLLHEDVGRHNAVDKVIGAMLLSGQLPLAQSILLLSGRISFELVQKAAIAGIPFIAAVGAPSSMAVDAAERFGITLVGFLRGEGQFNLYSGRNPFLP